MRPALTKLGVVVLMAAYAQAEEAQLLFKSGLTGVEYAQAKTNLKKTAIVVSDEEWAAMTTEDFAKFEAIVIGDNSNCRADDALDFFKASQDKWAPAITGNIVTFSTAHVSSQQEVWTKIIDQAITFAASGDSKTGLYFTTSCLPEGESSIDALSPFGDFLANDKTPTNQRNPTHQVGTFPSVGAIDDEELGDWGINLAGSFTKFPNSGPNAFDPMFISKSPDAFGQISFADGTTGFPFILARYAIPVGCGDGKFDQDFEECDSVKMVKYRRNSTCTFNCHCADGLVCPKGKPSSSASSLTLTSTTGSASDYGSSTGAVKPTLTGTSSSTHPIHTGDVGHGDGHGNGNGGHHYPHGDNIIGIEIILIIDYVYVCPPGSTVTTTSTTCLSTLTRPVYHTKVPGYPCYPCMLGDADEDEYSTIIWTSCPATPDPTPTITVQHCHSCEYTTYTTAYPEYTPGAACHSCAIADEEITLPTAASAAAPIVHVGGAQPGGPGIGAGLVGGVAVIIAAFA